ncbi:hypothetical protein DITRI_Ditri07aG0061400 [Diplodiscus trichospermus]
MEKLVFIRLCDILHQSYDLENGKDVSIFESMAIFLLILGHAYENKMAQERFQLGETIARWYGIVSDAICCMAIDYLKPFDPYFKGIPRKIKDDNRYWPYFKDCIGAIDGTHVAIVIPALKQIPYIGRKRSPTQNIMAACDFNMWFTFAWAGWEGATYDARIFLEAVRRENLNFPHPPRGKYYLVDAGYSHMKGTIQR